MTHHVQRGSTPTWRNAPTTGVDVGGTRFVCRQIGPDIGVPVIFLNHLAAELNRWDPRVVDGIATRRRVIAFDNRGIGASEGTTPSSMEAMARDAVAFIKALGLAEIDLSGFSMGGSISQVVAHEERQTGPEAHPCWHRTCGGHGHRQGDVGDDPRHGKGCADLQASGVLSLLHRDPQRPQGGAKVPGTAGRAYRQPRQAGVDRRVDRPTEGHTRLGRQRPADLSRIRHPVVVANGDHDRMVPSSNSVDLVRRVPGAELVLYEDAGHGGIFQYHEAFVNKAVESLKSLRLASSELKKKHTPQSRMRQGSGRLKKRRSALGASVELGCPTRERFGGRP
jgi:pimeloyl-ACP methyl ester carboxylesterase